MRPLRKVGIILIIIGVVLELLFASWYFALTPTCLYQGPGGPICGAPNPYPFYIYYSEFYLGLVFVIVGIILTLWPLRKGMSPKESLGFA